VSQKQKISFNAEARQKNLVKYTKSRQFNNKEFFCFSKIGKLANISKKLYEEKIDSINN